MSWNVRLLTTINGWSGNAVPDAIMLFCARYLIFAMFAALALLVVGSLRRRAVRPVALTGVALVAAFGFSLLGAMAHPELRPFQTHPVHLLLAHPGGQSFPSDHATAAFAIALAVLVLLSRRWGAVLLLAATLVAVSRVYAGLHYPGDVLGGAVAGLLGITVAGLAARFTRRAGSDPGAPRPRWSAAPAANPYRSAG